ncbi:SufE-like protein, chloroplastic [Termitomyces sp. J132]|nr:SufE-like protein, chloroplastic [Termitomyces sp. J132]
MRAQGGDNGETHFSVQIVSDAFKEKVIHLPQTTMQRHRLVYSVLSEELAQGLHSLSLRTRTTDEIQ